MSAFPYLIRYGLRDVCLSRHPRAAARGCRGGWSAHYFEKIDPVTVTLTGKESGIVAVEAAGRCGRLFLESTHTDLLTGRALCGNIELAPYEALVLKK